MIIPLVKSVIVYNDNTFNKGVMVMAVDIISKEEAMRKLNNENMIIVDARPEDVYTEDSDQIEGAIHLPEVMTHEVYTDLPKNREYLIYASKEDQDLSKRIADFLRDKGFSAYALQGGFEEWRDSAMPIEPINAKGTPME